MSGVLVGFLHQAGKELRRWFFCGIFASCHVHGGFPMTYVRQYKVWMFAVHGELKYE
jgi:hypothetical protein